MKIGIDAHGVGGHSLGLGNETYFRNLIANLLPLDSQNEYHVFANHPEALADIAAKHANVRVVSLRPHTQWIQRPLSMPLYARRHGLDIVHVPFVRPPLTGAKTIITVHDINYEVYPKDFTFTERVRMKVLVRRSCRRADAIFTVSEWAKQQLHDLYRVPLERILVTPNAADHLRRVAVSSQQPPFELPDNFILFVGMIQPKKNLVRLVQAFDLLKSRTSLPHKLVIAGTWGWNNDELEKTLKSAQYRSDIPFPGYVSQQDLGTVMPKAYVFVFPSLYESFGIPPMEAQRCGMPALVSDSTCFPEIYRDSVLYCDPYSVESIANGLQILLQDSAVRNRFRASAPANLTRFSWRRTAEIALAAYERICRQAVPCATRKARSMKAALYYPWIYLRSGCERTIAQLVSHSRHDWTIFTSRYEPESTFPELNNLKIVQLDKVPVKRSFAQVAKAAARIALTKLPLQDHAALFVFCEGLGDLITLRNRRIPVVCLCFTSLRAVFDPHYCSNYLELNGNGRMRRALLHGVGAIFRLVDRLLWRSYDAVFAISSEVRERIVRGGLRRRENVDLAHPGVTVSDFHATGEYSQTFVIPGRIMWTKNIELGIKAFKLFVSHPANASFSLVIAGFVEAKSKPYIAKLRTLAADTPNIRFVERPSDEELFAICSSAYAILYTPFNEDWGLAPLEAMCLEKPVISVNRGGPTELIIDRQTGLLVEDNVADDPALVRRMGAAGRARAAAFDWRQFAAKIDAYIDALPVKEEVAGYAFKSAH